MNPTFSIIIRTYNQASLLKNAIDSAAKYFDEQITVGIRNGDTSPYEKKKQSQRYDSCSISPACLYYFNIAGECDATFVEIPVKKYW